MKYKVTRKMPVFHKPNDPAREKWYRYLFWAAEDLDITNLRRAYNILRSLEQLNGLEIK